MKKIDRKALLNVAQGYWPMIIGQLAPQLQEAVSNLGSSKHCQCPFPERHSQSQGAKKFRLWDNGGSYNGQAICSCGSWSDGIALLMDVTGLPYPQLIRHIDALTGSTLGLEPAHDFKPVVRTIQQSKPAVMNRTQRTQDERRKAALSKIWRESIPVTDVKALPLQRYLSRRGLAPQLLKSLSDTVRFHPGLDYWTASGKLWGEFPALIGMLTDKDDRAITLHRTYLSEDGAKAPVPPDEDVKKLMSAPSDRRITGSVIRLFDKKGSILAVAEGIETAIAVHQVTHIPCWATYSANNMAKLDLSMLDGVERLFIFADKDRSLTGEDAAKKLKQRAWEHGIKTQILLPGTPIPDGDKGVDWNDVLNRRGRYGFPSAQEMLTGGLLCLP